VKITAAVNKGNQPKTTFSADFRGIVLKQGVKLPRKEMMQYMIYFTNKSNMNKKRSTPPILK
jgi:hypothetical protein